jgi:hypothetical protein
MPSLLNMYDSVLNATGFTRLDIQTLTYKREKTMLRIYILAVDARLERFALVLQR